MKRTPLFLTLVYLSLTTTSCVHIPDPGEVANAPLEGPLETSKFSIATPRGQKWNKFAGSYLSVGPVAYAISSNASVPAEGEPRRKLLEISAAQFRAKYLRDGWTSLGGESIQDGNPGQISSRWRDEDGETVQSETTVYFGNVTTIVHALISPDGSRSDALRVLKSFREK